MNMEHCERCGELYDSENDMAKEPDTGSVFGFHWNETLCAECNTLFDENGPQK